ncbi:protein-L-isoaspartate(D-aspartate) O-methyltransferase [Streptomyces sp. Z26]|uniref:protein-L-isoaspartate O-methyltransferase family protein n=1 Tax=Streptomyces sp. Z26 TaxID=2500177 RepID=UPI000EF16E4B|nr:protein-L-isoaspartate(D-aspartate) O-methyltransferase [Streptomyces sp. Z26]RLL66703.1 protein-L-isoaspartate(D-aspartate) O-methyltransferase [Streptomyces sp. Z26]
MEHRRISRAELDAMGAFRSPRLRAAFDAVDREAFAPDRFWGYDTDDHGLHEVVDKHRDEEAWRRTVWGTHRSLILQMDDGVTPEQGPARGDFTSSISGLDIVFEKLNRLDVRPDSCVLHLGTASGYDSALLCELVGDGNVTTVECDPVLAAGGAANLARAGYGPTTVTGDGLVGWPPNAPYDRIVSTAAVRGVPEAWCAQAGEGAVVLTPFNTLFAPGGLPRLGVRGGVAEGRFVGGACYMWARGHRPVRRIDPPDRARKEASVLDPAEVPAGDWADRFALGLLLPDVAYACRGEGEGRRTQLWDEDGTSVAVVRHGAWWLPDAVTVYGRRNLWAELVRAYTVWRCEGQPHYQRFGLTYDARGRRLWLDDPAVVLRSSPHRNGTGWD